MSYQNLAYPYNIFEQSNIKNVMSQFLMNFIENWQFLVVYILIIYQVYFDSKLIKIEYMSFMCLFRVYLAKVVCI